MTRVLELPPELAQFLKREPPQSLLIRGPPGTGKTSLAVSLFNNFPSNKAFVTSRVSRSELIQEFPGLAHDPTSHIVETAMALDSLRETARVLGHLRELLTAPEKELDSRGLWLPDPLREAFSLVGGSKPGLIVIDSWDALVERYVGTPGASQEWLPDRAELERLLLEQMGRGPLFVIMVSEHSEPAQLDYLVNGVVEMGWLGLIGREERWLFLRKLRGIRVDTRAYPFTLDGGKFQCIQPMPNVFQSRLQTPDPDPDASAQDLWPGSRDFADAFGRLPIGGITLLESGPSVPNEAIRQVYAPIVSQVLHAGGRVIHVLPPSVRATDVLRSFRYLLSDERFTAQVRIQPITASPEVPENLRSIILPVPRREPDESGTRFPEGVRFFEGAPTGVCNLLVAWMSGLIPFEPDPRTDPTPGMLQVVIGGITHRVPVHIVFVAPAGSHFAELVRPIASIHIRVTGESGRVFLSGEQPVTPSFALTEQADRKGFRLLPIV